MSATLTYNVTDEASVKTTFNQLMVARGGDKDQVLIDMKQNHIAVTNADDWEDELKETIEIML
jgi:hypothetical protein